MKSSYFIILIVFFLNTTLLAQVLPEMRGSHFCSMKKSQINQLPDLVETMGTTGVHTFDVLDYTLKVNLYHCFTSPYPTDFKGSNTVTFKVDSTLNSIRLNAVHTSLAIDSVRLAGVSFSLVNDTLTILLNRSYNPGEIAQVKIYYRHLNVTDNAVYASGGMFFTDCEPEGARRWFPCWDKPSDKATLDLTAKVPSTVKFASNGKLMDSTFNGDTLTYHWQSIHNIATYLMVMTSKVNYKLDILYWHKLSNPADSIPIRFYYNPGENPAGMEAIIKPMMTWYSQKFCEHPFQKNGFASLNSQFFWGGMENQTLTSICPGCWIDWLIAHEFAHQWFGDMITCGTWADVWLNEGFATWCEASWAEYSGGYTAYKTEINGDASYYLANNPGWPIYNPSWVNNTPNVYVLFNTAVTYDKGACVLHMLRHILGDSLFFETLQTYCADTNLKFKSAVTADFNAEVNTVTGQDFNWFFNEWIDYPNHPQYKNTYFLKNPVNGKWNVDFVTTQIQTNAPFFKMPLEIKVHFIDNTDTIIHVMNDTIWQEYTWIFQKQPDTVIFDPNNDIVLKLSSTSRGKVWTGMVSSNWNVAGNWSPAGVPVSQDVTIPKTAPNPATVNAAGMTCGSVIIEKGANLIISATDNLTINGNLVINGPNGP
jgi:aminopeptidase N